MVLMAIWEGEGWPWLAVLHIRKCTYTHSPPRSTNSCQRCKGRRVAFGLEENICSNQELGRRLPSLCQIPWSKRIHPVFISGYKVHSGWYVPTCPGSLDFQFFESLQVSSRAWPLTDLRSLTFFKSHAEARLANHASPSRFFCLKFKHLFSSMQIRGYVLIPVPIEFINDHTRNNDFQGQR